MRAISLRYTRIYVYNLSQIFERNTVPVYIVYTIFLSIRSAATFTTPRTMTLNDSLTLQRYVPKSRYVMAFNIIAHSRATMSLSPPTLTS